MDRPTGLTDQNNNTAVSYVSYNPANQLLGITYFSTNESRTYNSLNQMTNLTVSGQLNITYTFPSSTNNGKISSQMDSISGETVTYQYDSLNRLLTAAGSGWGETYAYDGFGNLLSKTGTGTGPTLSQSVNASTNRVVGQSYDSNGNQTSSSAGTLAYDAENRVLTGPGLEYGYDSRNKRVWSATLSGGVLTQTVHIYGADGQKIGSYPFVQVSSSIQVFTDSGPTLAVFFGSKRVGMISSTGVKSAFVQDRLGSSGKYYPYGEARGTVPQDAVGFATYTNDSATGLQYADQRYYASNFGRFMSPDPYSASGGPTSPQSWNRYTYVLGDPITLTDPEGLTACASYYGFIYCYDSVTVNGDTGEVFFTDSPGSGSVGTSPSQMKGRYQKRHQVMDKLIDAIDAYAVASGCPNGETKMANGTCDIALNQMAVDLARMLYEMNPQGFINSMGLAVAGAMLAGDLQLALFSGSWLIEGSGNAILLGRYADGYVTLGGIVGANTFSIPQDIWQTMTAAQQWAVNQTFLEDAIADNSTIMFSSNPALAAAGSGLQQEYQYLLSQGFKVVQDSNGGWIAVH